jgi:hypothetical protein
MDTQCVAVTLAEGGGDPLLDGQHGPQAGP